jgi:hypothetical protein
MVDASLAVQLLFLKQQNPVHVTLTGQLTT